MKTQLLKKILTLLSLLLLLAEFSFASFQNDFSISVGPAFIGSDFGFQGQVVSPLIIERWNLAVQGFRLSENGFTLSIFEIGTQSPVYTNGFLCINFKPMLEWILASELLDNNVGTGMHFVFGLDYFLSKTWSLTGELGYSIAFNSWNHGKNIGSGVSSNLGLKYYF